jgi:hypothetical protein
MNKKKRREKNKNGKEAKKSLNDLARSSKKHNRKKIDKIT